MSALPPLIDTNGRPVPLDRQLGNPGGEGTVFALSNDLTLAAKVYHKPPTVQTAEKLTAMVRLANPQLAKLAAWPMGLLYQARTRQLAGFVMPRLKDCQPIQQLYNPVQRLTCYPKAGWNFQVRAAMNLAAAFDEVHKAGCLVGDVNQSNAQVSTQALVWLIDCDSFQVRANGKPYLCEVGVAHYTPPELQGKPLRGLIRTENHDRFGLAVLIYQLLFVGRHPYAGVYNGPGDPSFEQLIAEYRFAQGPAARTWGMSPPPHTPTFNDIPPYLAGLFRRAFERGSEAGNRPKPVEWLSALRQLEQSIVECPADAGHKYWREAKSCVWCRLAEHGGPEYYFGVAGDVGAFVVDEAKLQEVKRRLRACELIEFPYNRDRFTPHRAREPEPLPEGIDEHRSTAIILGVAVGICVLAMPLGLIHGALCLVASLGAIVFGVWLGIHFSVSPWHREHRRRRSGRSLALHDLKAAEDQWYGTVEDYQQDYSAINRKAQRLMSECRDLPSQYQDDMQRLMVNAEAAARTRHLRLHSIADADIPKVGEGRKQTLAAHNIFTAADVDERAIRRIKGFGEVLTKNMLAWKQGVLRQFKFNPATAVSAAEQRPVTLKYRTRQQQIFVELDRELGKLASLAPACESTLKRLIPSLQQSVAVYEQAKADLDLMDGKQ
jgi:DNA-binding helix-hairpin-helix protein with protein kinase domain